MPDFVIRLNNGSNLTRQEFELTPGYSVTLKIEGQYNKEHLMLKSSNERIRLTQKADNKKREQALTVTAVSEGSSEITSVTKGINQCNITELKGKVSDCFPKLTFVVLPTIGIPANLTPRQKAMVQVLLSETSTPENGDFNQKDAKEAMTLMHDTLYNRIALPKAQYLDVPQDGRDKLLGLIFNGRVIEGFKGNTISPGILTRINIMLTRANDGGSDMKKYRSLISDAIAIAGKDTIILSHEVIGWRTKNNGLGGNNFELYKNLQGQAFIKLKADFLK